MLSGTLKYLRDDRAGEELMVCTMHELQVGDSPYIPGVAR
jgi:hypothetical protein